MDVFNSSLDFTSKAWDKVFDAVDDKSFAEREADLIFNTLHNETKAISFGDYLKRYIYKKAELRGHYDEIPLKTYQEIIAASFADTMTPKAFGPTTAKLGALTKNWLTQQSVKRQVVFLLGFGLSMSVEDVNDFLRKALQEQGINAKSPFEVICHYCYKNGYGYPKFEELWEAFENTPPGAMSATLLYSDATVGIRQSVFSLNNDASLIAFLAQMKMPDNRPLFSVTTRKHFDALYQQACELIAASFNEADAEKGRKWTADEITEADFENVICAAIPTDSNGNLVAAKISALNQKFSFRFSRQHIRSVLDGKTEVSRFDLITLNLFIFSQQLSQYKTRMGRYQSFLDSTNKILTDCWLEELYLPNPYESFVLMCILSEDPLVTYADTLEKAYDNDTDWDA